MKHVRFSQYVVVYHFINTAQDTDARRNDELINAFRFKCRIDRIDKTIGHIFNPAYRSRIFLLLVS